MKPLRLCSRAAHVCAVLRLAVIRIARIVEGLRVHVRPHHIRRSALQAGWYLHRNGERERILFGIRDAGRRRRGRRGVELELLLDEPPPQPNRTPASASDATVVTIFRWRICCLLMSCPALQCNAKAKARLRRRYLYSPTLTCEQVYPRRPNVILNRLIGACAACFLLADPVVRWPIRSVQRRRSHRRSARQSASRAPCRRCIRLHLSRQHDAGDSRQRLAR